MAGSFEVTVEAPGARELAFTYGSASKLVARTIVSNFRRLGATLVRVIVRDKLRGGVLDKRTGNLGRAIGWRIELMGRDPALLVGVDLTKAKYGRVQEQGGVIVPVHAQNLTIPVNEALTAAGVGRFSARELFESPASFGYKRAFINPRKTAILGVTEDGDTNLLFVLKKQVRLQPAGYLSSTLREQRGTIVEQLGLDIKDALETGDEPS